MLEMSWVSKLRTGVVLVLCLMTTNLGGCDGQSPQPGAVLAAGFVIMAPLILLGELGNDLQRANIVMLTEPQKGDRREARIGDLIFEATEIRTTKTVEAHDNEYVAITEEDGEIRFKLKLYLQSVDRNMDKLLVRIEKMDGESIEPSYQEQITINTLEIDSGIVVFNIWGFKFQQISISTDTIVYKYINEFLEIYPQTLLWLYKLGYLLNIVKCR